MARSSGSPAPHQARCPEPCAHRTDLSAFRYLRRLRAAALEHRALSRMETRLGSRDAGASRLRDAGRWVDRCPWRGPLPPGSFLQATVAGEAALAGLVAEHCGSAANILDLFAGVGPFALRLAERARITAADSDKGAIAALRRAAEMTGRLKPVEVQARDLYRRPFVRTELKTFDAVVFDPPRQGAEAQARELAASAVPVVVAVSCNALTFARDARLLIEGGYRLARVTPVDQFRYSPHVELVGKFQRT